jgi:hypothetical protein
MAINYPQLSKPTEVERTAHAALVEQAHARCLAARRRFHPLHREVSMADQAFADARNKHVSIELRLLDHTRREADSHLSVHQRLKMAGIGTP